MSELFQTNKMKGQKMNYTESNERRDENMNQNEGNAMNDLQDRNTSGNDASSNDDASQRGVNMDTGSMSQSNDTGRNVVSGTQHSNSNSERGGENMELKKRTKYDGSYAHGVSADIIHINTILAYTKALSRLKNRRNFLVKEYQGISEKYQNTDSIAKRAELLKDKSSKEAQIKTVDKTREDLEKLEDEIKVAERESQESVSFETYEIED